MQTEIAVALITGCTALGGVVLTPVLVSRQAKDLRVMIEREIDIARKLRPGSEEAVLLENHISTSIQRLVRRDESRDRLRGDLRPAAHMVLATVFVVGLLVLRDHGVPEPWHTALEVAIVFAYLVFAVTIARVWLFIFKAMKPAMTAAVRVSTLVAAYGWYRTRLVYLKARVRLVNRRAARMLRQVDANLTSYRDVRRWDTEMQELFLANKDKLIARYGQEWWDDMASRRAELDEVIRDLDKDVEVIEKGRQTLTQDLTDRVSGDDRSSPSF